MGGHFELTMTYQLLLIGSWSVYIFHKGSKGVTAAMWCVDVFTILV